MDESLLRLPAAGVGQNQQHRKLMLLLTTTIENFKRTLYTNRRRSQQRLRRKQAIMRNFFVQQMLEMETSLMELLPLGLLEAPSVSSQLPEEFTGGRGFYEIAVESFSDAQWLQAFRLSRRTFHWLCEQLRDFMQPGAVMIAPEKCIAVALYAFVSGEDYRVIALLFSVSRVAVCRFMHRFAEALLQTLGSYLLALPRTEQDYEDISVAFESASNMPPIVVGVMGVCQISSTSVLGSGDKGIMLQALIDDRLLFRKIDVESKTASLLVNSPNELSTLPPKMLHGRILPHCVIAPPTQYPLLPWLLHAYEIPAAAHEVAFNEAVHSVEQYRERAFAKLLGRWHILQRKSDLETHTMERITAACCALHNLLEENDEAYMTEWEKDVEASKWRDVQFTANSWTTLGEPRALELRDFIAHIIGST